MVFLPIEKILFQKKVVSILPGLAFEKLSKSSPITTDHDYVQTPMDCAFGDTKHSTRSDRCGFLCCWVAREMRTALSTQKRCLEHVGMWYCRYALLRSVVATQVKTDGLRGFSNGEFSKTLVKSSNCNNCCNRGGFWKFFKREASIFRDNFCLKQYFFDR